MHPREGWKDGRRPPIFGPSGSGPSRRDFLRGGAASAVLLGGAGSLLAACSSSSGSGSSSSGLTSGGIPLPRPNHPVTWPIFSDNKPIKSGLAPEKGATLKIYNWVAYVNQQCLNDFAKKYNCSVQVTTFNTMSEALAKLSSGQVNFDVFMGVTVDVLGQADRAEAHPAAQPQLHPEHHPGLARLHQPVLRPALAVHGPVHDLHDRHRLAQGPRARGSLHDDEPLGHAVAVEVQGQGRDPRRLPGVPSASG